MPYEQIEKHIWRRNGGSEFCNEAAILSELLAADVLFCNDGKFDDERTICLFVNRNDLFAWGCADAESVTSNELPNLYRHWLAEKGTGVEKWCCKRRKQRPQAPIEKK